ncbi:MAG: hypothetical protein WDN69_37690 [Aliidongia sp.]
MPTALGLQKAAPAAKSSLLSAMAVIGMPVRRSDDRGPGEAAHQDRGVRQLERLGFIDIRAEIGGDAAALTPSAKS